MHIIAQSFACKYDTREWKYQIEDTETRGVPMKATAQVTGPCDYNYRYITSTSTQGERDTVLYAMMRIDRFLKETVEIRVTMADLGYPYEKPSTAY